MAKGVGHVRIDKPDKRNIARHRVIAHHVVDPLTLHDDTAKFRAFRKGVARRCPDERHVAVAAPLTKKLDDFKFRKP